MARRRQIDLSRLASEDRQKRLLARPPVREERLRAGDRLYGWRGHSGKRYVFKAHDVDACPAPPRHGVVAALSREEGMPKLLDVAVAMDAEAFEDWRRDAIERGAAEIQVHALTERHWEAEALVEDLGFEVRAIRSCGLGF